MRGFRQPLLMSMIDRVGSSYLASLTAIVRDGAGQLALARLVTLLAALVAVPAALADIPATPVMTLYKFNGDLNLPYFHVERFDGRGSVAPAGMLAQGTTLIPCLVVRQGRPLTDRSGTPFVGFEIVVDPRTATPDATARVTEAIAQRKSLRVANHHCPPGVQHVIDVRNLYAMEKVPFFDPPRLASTPTVLPAASSAADTIVRSFHNSAQCGQANVRLTGRRAALAQAWDEFERQNGGRWRGDDLAQARHLDYVMRTALFEGHLERGCNAYGACERNIVALSIRNRALERCFKREGCRARGDFTGVASTVSQYNIWDEYLAQISGLTACYLRDDLGTQEYYRRLQAMYAQNVPDVQRILFGSEGDLAELFAGASLDDVKRTAHYYHAPAMGKCFPGHQRVEYMSGAVARRGSDHALVANVRIQVGDKVDDGYRFRMFRFQETEERDVVDIRDDYPGFVVDGRKVALVGAGNCPPYGIPAGCPVQEVGRYRRVPPWLAAGKPVGLTCRIADRGESCSAPVQLISAQVGGVCDTQMRPVSGVH
jgi:hypothetical protein